MSTPRAPYHSNLWMLDAPGNGKHSPTAWKQLTNGTSLIERPRLSPVGQSIVFSIGHEPLANLHTMPITGGSPKQLTFLDSFNVGGAWSADGTEIAFASTQDGESRVWTIDAAGGTPRPLSSGDLSYSFDVVWSQVLGSFISGPGTVTITPSIRRPVRNGFSQRTVQSGGSFAWLIRRTAGRLPCIGIAGRTGVSGSSTPKNSLKS